MKAERDYGNIKAKLWRERGGSVCCELSSLREDFILLYVASHPLDEECEVVQTALRCLSSKDLGKAAA